MSCSTRQSEDAKFNDGFEFPPVLQKENIDSVPPINASRVSEFYPPLIGKFKFGDTVDFINFRREKRSEQDYLWEVRNVWDSDTLSSDGLQIIPDYNTSIAYFGYGYDTGLYFPVYIVNETPETRIFFGKDDHGFGLQEVIDTSDYSSWHPIEAQWFAFCGNGYFRKKLDPMEFLVFLFPKYLGSDTALFRIRFKIGETVLISKSYRGAFNTNQFNIDINHWFYSSLKETKGNSASGLFYGGNPKGEWD
jgi:hypothetical protein